MNQRKLILYICMSLDGFLATENDSLDWLSVVEKKGEDYGYAAFTSEVDTYIVGRKTYDTVLKLTGGAFPQAKMFETCYVITRQEKENRNGVIFYNKSLKTLIEKLKEEKTEKHIYCDGGAEVVKLLMQDNLIDEFIISIIPIILGNGKRLFKGGIDTINLKLIECKNYETGLVQLHYKK